MYRAALFTISLAGLGLVLAACQNEYTAYDEAKAANTPEAYRAFMEEYPEGVNVSDAQVRLDTLEWNAAVEANTAEAYEDYLAKHPEGEHATKAAMEAPKLAWQEVEAAGDMATLDAFIEKYGTTAYGKKAKDRKALLELIPKHLEIAELKLEEQEEGKDFLVSADVKNVGDKTVKHANFRVTWMDAEGKIVRTKRWLLVCEEQEGVDAPKELTKPFKPGETRTFSFDFDKSEASDTWAGDAAHTRLELVELEFLEG